MAVRSGITIFPFRRYRYPSYPIQRQPEGTPPTMSMRAPTTNTSSRGAGIRVHYCAEQSENDGSMSSSVLETLKRSMAAEYSRELSVKVFSGQCRLIELGFAKEDRQDMVRDGN
jgi:hypothetical protein